MDKISAHVGLPSALIFSSTSSGEARGKSSIKLDTKPHHTSLTPSPCRLDLAPACSPDVHGTSPKRGHAFSGLLLGKTGVVRPEASVTAMQCVLPYIRSTLVDAP